MPQWNLSSDLADIHGARAFAYPVCYAFASAPSTAVDVTHARVVRETPDGPAVLRVGVSAASDAYAMVAGRVAAVNVHDAGAETGATVTEIRIETDLFIALATDMRSLSRSEAYWFRQWLESPAGTIPMTLVYDSLESTALSVGEVVDAGQPLGRLSSGHLFLRFEYAPGVTSSETRHVHPVEMLSLLFWREEHDPLFRETPTDPPHPLIRAMAARVSGGDQPLGAYLEADWIGLRPPLRTFKRVEWEARQTHRTHHDNWQRDGEVSTVLRNPLLLDATTGLANPYLKASKCNVIVGDLAFRAGFRTTTSTGELPVQYVSGGSYDLPCDSDACDGDSVVINRGGTVRWNGVEYQRTLPFGRKMHVDHTGDDWIRINERIDEEGRVFLHARQQFCLRWTTARPWTVPAPGPDDDPREPHPGGQSPPRCLGDLPSGHDPKRNRTGWITENQTAVNEAVAAEVAGGAIDNERLRRTVVDRLIAASPWGALDTNDSYEYEYKMFHVFVIARLAGVLSTGLTPGSRGIDQHCSATDYVNFTTLYDAVHWTGCYRTAERTFLELIPGGDPSERWGVVDLNCLTRS